MPKVTQLSKWQRKDLSQESDRRATFPATPGVWQHPDEEAGEGLGRWGSSKERGLGLNLLPVPGSSLRLRCVTEQDLSEDLASEAVLSLLGALRAWKKDHRAGTCL